MWRRGLSLPNQIPEEVVFLVDGLQRRVLPRNHAMPFLYRQSIR